MVWIVTSLSLVGGWPVLPERMAISVIGCLAWKG